MVSYHSSAYQITHGSEGKTTVPFAALLHTGMSVYRYHASPILLIMDTMGSRSSCIPFMNALCRANNDKQVSASCRLLDEASVDKLADDAYVVAGW